MTDEPTEEQAAARLLKALEAQDDLSCDEARTRLSALVEAEAAGVDVDAAPEFAALLRHIDHCEGCTELYAQLAADLEALGGAAGERLEAPAPPAFFAPARQSDSVVLRVLGGLRRRFELKLALPRLAPSLPTLGSGKRADLFTDTLAEVSGAPLVAVSLVANAGVADVLVAVREASAQTRWQVQLIAGDRVQTATTDEQGIARFGGLAIATVQDVTVSCVEIGDSDAESA